MAKNSKWFKVATSGPTVDGREIKEEWVRDMAETYDPAEYTANIFQDHWSWYGNYGRVTAVKGEKDDKGRLCLFAKIEANKLLLKLNEAGQKLFPSIRVIEDFANTGKAYLGHLAITDEPASLGTDQLSFSANGETSLIFATDGVVLDFNTYTDDELEAEAVKRPGLLDRIFKKHSPEKDEMSKKDLEALQAQFSALTEKVDKLAGTTQEGGTDDELKDFKTQVADLEKKVADLEAEKAEFQKGQEGVNQLKSDLAKLQKDFADALKDATPDPSKQTGGKETEFDIF